MHGYDITVDALAEANPEIQDINVIFPGQTLCIPRWGIYVVQEGDNLTEIANNFNTTVDALVAANGIEDPDLIFEDHVLFVPFTETYTVQEGDNLTSIARILTHPLMKGGVQCTPFPGVGAFEASSAALTPYTDEPSVPNISKMRRTIAISDSYTT